MDQFYLKNISYSKPKLALRGFFIRSYFQIYFCLGQSFKTGSNVKQSSSQKSLNFEVLVTRTS